MSPIVTVLTATATSAVHERRHVGNEDAAGSRSSSTGTVLAVADGHSDPRCVRADRGARFAVQAAIELPEGTASAEALVARWRALVAADLRRDPLPDPDPPRTLAYGTTVIACWIAADRLHLLQIGDGVAVVATRTGARIPIPPRTPDRPFETESLALPGAEVMGRAADVPGEDPLVVVCLSTDGVDGAYPDDRGVRRAVEQLRTLAAEHGAAALQPQLDAWVADAAATSGDDATVAIAVVEDAGSRA